MEAIILRLLSLRSSTTTASSGDAPPHHSPRWRPARDSGPRAPNATAQRGSAALRRLAHHRLSNHGGGGARH
uniref:Uncharacterized protein n=1 Tax=Arundo donax TaxID=35708 RepID=A0A0A9BA58_ARUDO